MIKAGQEDSLVAFRSGSCKVLVSTAVAEEGLDIKECNLIVTYNYSTNEIGKLLRKGTNKKSNVEKNYFPRCFSTFFVCEKLSVCLLYSLSRSNFY